MITDDRVWSADGTAIAYRRQGTGEPVILVGGGLDDGTENEPLAEVLAEQFTVINYSRRGRGDSGNTQPYSVRQEVADLAALVPMLDGGPVHLFGASSGGALALTAAAEGLPVSRIAVYEVPYQIGAAAVDGWQQYRARLAQLLADDDRAGALELFMRLAGASEEDVRGASSTPYWPGLLEVAPTLAYDAACIGDGPPPASLAAVRSPTLVITGEVGADPHTAGLPDDFFGAAADELVAVLPDAVRRTLPAQGHVADPAVLGEVLAEFYRGRS